MFQAMNETDAQFPSPFEVKVSEQWQKSSATKSSCFRPLTGIKVSEHLAFNLINSLDYESFRPLSGIKVSERTGEWGYKTIL